MSLMLKTAASRNTDVLGGMLAFKWLGWSKSSESIRLVRTRMRGIAGRRYGLLDLPRLECCVHPAPAARKNLKPSDCPLTQDFAAQRRCAVIVKSVMMTLRDSLQAAFGIVNNSF